MATINSISASFFISQTTISISTVGGADKSDDPNLQVASAPKHSHDHRQLGTGFFIQSVMHALAGLGLNVPRSTSGNGDKESSDNSSDQADKKPADLARLLTMFLRDLNQISARRAGTEVVPADTGSSAGGNAEDAGQTAQVAANVVAAGSIAATGGADANQAQVSSAATPKSSSVIADNSVAQAATASFGEVLHGFLHELRRALQQNSDRASDENGHKAREYWGRNAGWHGYRYFSANLDNLIADLTGADQADSSKYKSLTEGFNRLVDLISGGNGGARPSLLAFLTELKDEVANQHPGSVSSGSIVSTSV